MAMPTTSMMTMSTWISLPSEPDPVRGTFQYLDYGSRLAGLHLAHRYLPLFVHKSPFQE